MTENLKYIEIYNKPKESPNGVIIILHGLGANAHDFVPLVSELNLNKSFKFIFPDAPTRPITLNGGFNMQAWYDISELSIKASATDIYGINQSVLQIEELINQQIELGFKSEQIVLGGFSQGGVMSCITAINTKHKLSGVLVLSGYLPEIDLNLKGGINETTKFLICHGSSDQVVNYSAGVGAYERLLASGYNVTFKSYNMGHFVHPDEIRDIENWINSLK